MISTGIDHLDKVTGGLKLGDNVVWQISDAVPVDIFIRSFFRDGDNYNDTVIYINFNYSPYTIFKRYDYLFKNKRTILVDAFTRGKGNSDPVFLDFYRDDLDYPAEKLICVDNPRDIKSFMDLLNTIETGNRDGSFYIFDSLTGMNELWKNETAVLDFFTFTCPKLYDLNTLAYWIFEKNAHSKEFIAGVTHVTQVVFALSSSDADSFRLSIKKLEDRPSFADNETNYFKIINQNVHFIERLEGAQFRIGEKVKEQRKFLKIKQADLASFLNMTPGAVSQIENDLTTPSLQTLIQIASFFNKPLDYFLASSLRNDADRGYLLSQKKAEAEPSSRPVAISNIFDTPDLPVRIYTVFIRGNSTISDPLILHKGGEIISVISGTVTVTIREENLTLKKGDSLYLKTAFINQWHNKNKSDCEILYILL